MKILMSLAILLFLTCFVFGQKAPVSKQEFDSKYRYALVETNRDFPFVFVVTTTFFDKSGNPARTVTDRHERQDSSLERTTRTTSIDGKKSFKYEIVISAQNRYCSDDGEWWTNSKYVCLGPVSFYPPRSFLREALTKEMRSDPKTGKRLRVFRKYKVFAPKKDGGREEFSETEYFYDERGFFHSVVSKEGLLAPLEIRLMRKQIWTKEKFEPVVAPTKVRKSKKKASGRPITIGGIGD